MNTKTPSVMYLMTQIANLTKTGNYTNRLWIKIKKLAQNQNIGMSS